MNKSLTPFIVLMALVILLTLALLSVSNNEKIVKYEDEEVSFKLSHISVPAKRMPRRVNPGETKPGNNEIERHLAAAYEHMLAGDFKPAEDKLRDILVFEPGNIDAIAMLGGIFIRSGRYAEAELMFQRRLKLQPDNRGANIQMADLLTRQNQLENALNYWENAVSDPDSGRAEMNMAMILVKLGRRDEALKKLRAAQVKLGNRIQPILQHPCFDLIRGEIEFQNISEAASQMEKSGGENTPATDKP